jgi:hypothetical protein
MLLGAPVAAHKIGRDPVQPGTQRGSLRLEGGAAAVGRRERLGHQILGKGRTDPPGDEPVNRREVLLEGDLEVRRVDNATLAGRRPIALHVYVLSRAPDPFPGANTGSHRRHNWPPVPPPGPSGTGATGTSACRRFYREPITFLSYGTDLHILHSGGRENRVLSVWRP